MTKKQLIEALKDFPLEMDVFLEKINDEYHYSLVEKVCVKSIEFYDADDPENKETRTRDNVIVITDNY